jgi:tripartite-type tricarboxylate transporter receptor subunit TctC
MTIAPAMAKLNHDPIKDFAADQRGRDQGFVLVVHKDFPPKTLAEFISHVKAQKEKMKLCRRHPPAALRILPWRYSPSARAST